MNDPSFPIPDSPLKHLLSATHIRTHCLMGDKWGRVGKGMNIKMGNMAGQGGDEDELGGH